MGQSRPGRASSKSADVWYAAEADVNSEPSRNRRKKLIRAEADNGNVG
jgi:hypothetical protein